MNKIAIYGNRSQADALKNIPHLFEFLCGNGFRVFVHNRFYNYLEQNRIAMSQAVPVEHIPNGVSLVLSLGGDGTFLRSARWIGEKEIPIMGVNTGHLGFLSSCDISGVEEMLRNVCNGEVTVERRMVIEVVGDSIPEDLHFALNEIVFMRDGSSSMISVRAKVNDNFLADYRGDGLIVSTPTGSTAYSLSAGGPIIEPTIDCICLCPVAPHTLTLRPLVTGPESVIELFPESRSGKFTLSLDDRSVILPAKTSYTIRKASFSVLLIRKKEVGFASILREKLLWSAGTTL